MDPAQAAEDAHKLTKQWALLAASERGDSEVAQFYEDATIFVTGGSGFLGKQLIEKLFRSCNVKTLYFLLRGKKAKTAQMRLKEMLIDPVYDTVRQQKPNFASKIFAVDGDVGELRLGLSEGDWRKITEEVDVIFHMAATVNFNADMVTATLINVRGTREVLHLSKACAHLRSIVHVSTTSCHTTKSRVNTIIKEEFYESPVSPETLIKMAEKNELKNLTKFFKSSKEWPNTYTFTKCVAEELVRSQAADLPLCVVRPAIVTVAYREPAPGWVDAGNVFGPSGLILSCITGAVHTFPADPDARADLVPVDVVNNAALAAAFHTARTHAPGDNISIYAVTNTRTNWLHRDSFRAMNIKGKEFSSPSAVWYNFVILTNFKIVYVTLYWLLHYIPAAVVDSTLFITGQKPRVLKMYKKYKNVASVYEYFTMNDWKFDDGNTLCLHRSLSPTDRDLFNCDVGSVDFNELLELWVLGIRRYIIKDGLQGTEYGRKKQFNLRMLHYVLFTIYLYLIFKLYSSTLIGFYKLVTGHFEN